MRVRMSPSLAILYAKLWVPFISPVNSTISYHFLLKLRRLCAT